jgi:CheY-like chemotaxis protein/HPt (histidine-containing phosphotransfer) domain-containing protein
LRDLIPNVQENVRTKLIMVSELADMTSIPGVSRITTPVYCVPLANALNGLDFVESCPAGQSGLPPFTAPSATVLVVDDVLTNLRVAKEMLAYYGIAVETCTDGAEAVERVRGKHYDLVFMDHMMPKMNGLEATLRIRKIGGADADYFRNLPIIALTANAIAGQKDLFLKHGFTGFLSKPVVPDLLDAVLRKWIPAEKQIPADWDAVEAARPPEKAEPWSDAPPAEPGMLDTAKGIRNAGGSKAAYAGVLGVCLHDCEFQAGRLQVTLAAGDFPAYAIAAHALKGSLRTVGAEELASSAERLETAALEGDAPFLRAETQMFINGLRELLHSFEGAIAALNLPGVPEGRGPEEADKPDLHALADALGKMDIRRVNDLLARWQNMALEPELRDLITKLDLMVTVFEYDKAIALIHGKRE